MLVRVYGIVLNGGVSNILRPSCMWGEQNLIMQSNTTTNYILTIPTKLNQNFLKVIVFHQIAEVYLINW